MKKTRLIGFQHVQCMKMGINEVTLLEMGNGNFHFQIFQKSHFIEFSP